MNGLRSGESKALRLGGNLKGNEPVRNKENNIDERGENKINVDDFEGLLKKIKTKMRGGILRHNENNVKLILRAIAASPTTAEYPHPALKQLFHNQMDKLEADKECVATWAAPEALGLKTKEGALVGKKEILGIYGGAKTKSKGIYVLDVTVFGSDQLLVDGDHLNLKTAYPL